MKNAKGHRNQGRGAYACVVLIAFLFSTSGCFLGGTEAVDAQDNLTPPAYQLANPTPLERDFRGNNSKHKILIAVIDSGVDYNHPDLLNNIHFKLDDQGQPLRAGYDFVGKDPWPAPYLIRHSQFPSPGENQEELEAEAFELPLLKQVLKAEPALNEFFDLRRHAFHEYGNAIGHGTHVAGILAKERDYIGILPYRVTPTKATDDHSELLNKIKDVIAAIHLAAKDGAKIVSISLLYVFPTETNPLSQSPIFTQPPKQEILAALQELQNTIRGYKQILFVAAAGNEGLWGPKDFTAAPCGFKAANVLCVGSLNEDHSLTSGTGVIAQKEINTIYARGANVRSTMPSLSCTPDDEKLKIYSAEINDAGNNYHNTVKDIAKDLLARCLKERGYGYMSGSSQATPGVAREAAEFVVRDEKPEISPSEIIQELLARTERELVKVNETSLQISKLIFGMDSRWLAQGRAVQPPKTSSLEALN